MSDRLDLDPPPGRSPRLYADVEAIPHSRPVRSALRSKPTEAQLARLRRDLAIYLAIEGGMSLRMAGKQFQLTHEGIRKSYLRTLSRKSRV